MEIFRVMLFIFVVVLLLVVAAHDPITIFPGAQPGEEQPCEGEYTLQSGDSLAMIAVKCGVSTAAIRVLNPQINDLEGFGPGVTIRLPGKGAYPGKAEACPDCSTVEEQAEVLSFSTSYNREYVVKPGDTLDRIAQKNGMDPEDIRQLNLCLSSTNKVTPGQVLLLPRQ